LILLLLLFEGSLILLNLTLLYNLTNVIKKGESIQKLMGGIIQIQKMDNTTYDSVDFEDFISTLSYFKKIDQIYTSSSEEEADQKFETMMFFLKRMIERDSESSAGVQAQQVMRLAAEKIHDAFRELNRDSFLITALSVMQVIPDANISLSRLVLNWIKEEFKYVQTSNEDLREGASDVYNIDWT
jgi:hypothetical protein